MSLTGKRTGTASPPGFFHDRANQLRVKCDPAGILTCLRYDPAGNLTYCRDGKNQTTQWLYDARNRTSDKIYPDSTTLHYTYDGVGNLKTVTDPYQRVSRYDYDENNNLTDVTALGTAPDIAPVHLTYDAWDHRKTMTDGLAATTWDYDDASQNTGITVVGGNNAWTDSFVLGYDAFGRSTSQTINGATVSTHFDTAGRLDWAVTASGTYNYAYPVVTGSAGTLTTKVASVTYPNGQVTAFGYYPNSGSQRLQTLWNKTGSGETDTTLSRFDYQYDAAGQITRWQQQAGAGAASVYDFENDAVGQLTSAVLKNVQSGAVQKTYRYAYDLAGNRTSETIDSAVTRDSHNIINQLTQRASGGAIPFGGTSDVPLSSVIVNGNPAVISGGTNFTGLASVVNGSNTVTVEAKDQSNPTNVTTNHYAVSATSGTATSATLTYDLNGNLLGDGPRTFEWDARNRLTAVNQGTHRTEFAYNGLGQRVSVIEKENGTIQSNKRLVWVNSELAEERDGVTNALNKRYNGSEITLASGSDAGTYFYTRDHLGSVRELTDTTGAIRARYDYDAWGNRSANQITSNPVEADFGFTGHYQHIASGLALAPYRAYDPMIGRWISRDPLGEPSTRLMAGDFARDPYTENTIRLSAKLPAEMLQGPNLYEYVRNNPTSNVDPDGLMTFQVGFSFNVQLGPISGNFSMGAIADGNGGFGFYKSGGAGVGAGGRLSGGISFGTSSGNCIEDYAGPFNNVSLGAAGGLSASGDAFWGPGAQGQPVVGGGVTVGVGLGGGGSGGGSVTSVTRIW